MKRTTAIFALILAAAMLLAGCRAKQVYTVYSKGVTYTVDKAEQTITDGKDIYKYECDPSDGGGYTVKFIYPDGNAYTVVSHELQEDFDPDCGYVDPLELDDVFVNRE